MDFLPYVSYSHIIDLSSIQCKWNSSYLWCTWIHKFLKKYIVSIRIYEYSLQLSESSEKKIGFVTSYLSDLRRRWWQSGKDCQQSHTHGHSLFRSAIIHKALLLETTLHPLTGNRKFTLRESVLVCSYKRYYKATPCQRRILGIMVLHFLFSRSWPSLQDLSQKILSPPSDNQSVEFVSF